MGVVISELGNRIAGQAEPLGRDLGKRNRLARES